MVTLLNNEMYIGEAFNSGGYWDERNMKEVLLYIDKSRNILEIGAHCGTSTLFYAKNTDKLIYAFEPQQQMYDLLIENIKQNSLEDRIQTYNTALFSYNGEINMNPIQDEVLYNYGGQSLGHKGELVPCVTLDSLELDDVGFIHCDAQGAENFIFSMGKEFLRKHRPTIYFENNQDIDPELYKGVVDGFPNESKHASFNLIKFCMEELGYKQYVRRFSGGDDLLIPS